MGQVEWDVWDKCNMWDKWGPWAIWASWEKWEKGAIWEKWEKWEKEDIWGTHAWPAVYDFYQTSVDAAVGRLIGKRVKCHASIKRCKQYKKNVYFICLSHT